MKRSTLIPSVILAGALAAACNDLPTAPEQESLPESLEPNASVSSGESFTRIAITDPSTSYYSLNVGATKQMSGKLYYSKGGTLPSSPYAQWSSTDNCVASVTSAYPSWGKVKGVKAGTALIIASSFGKADTVKVTVKGTGNTDPNCAQREWSWNYNDVSFTGSPAKSYGVKSGERLKRVVLFAPKSPVAVGSKLKLISELWYSGGGKLNGVPYVRFTTTDGSIATINDYGVARGRKVGRTKVIVSLGNLADTVPLYVK